MLRARPALLSVFLLAFLPACVQVTDADPGQAPVILSQTPVIHLADNLDEKDRLGWCIDTRGRGFSEQLHAHSCKPVGDDVRFRYNAATGQIQSAAYSNKCAAIVAAGNAAIPFGLVDCDSRSVAQQFDYLQVTKEIRPRNLPEHCITVSDVSRAAGPFSSRDLKLELCSISQPRHRQWIMFAGS